MKSVVVGSLNNTKLEAAKKAFAIVWPDEAFEFKALQVDSFVAEQPRTEEETIIGAKRRARFCQKRQSTADYFVGVEGGMYKLEGKWFNSDWAAVLDSSGREGVGGSPRYEIPERIAKHITDELHLTAAIEKELGHAELGSGRGYTGLTTGDHLTRTDSNRDAIVIALAPFIRPHFN